MQTIEVQELLTILEQKGFRELIDALYDPSVYTQTGRLKPSTLAKKLGWRLSRVTRALQEAKDWLEIVTR